MSLKDRKKLVIRTLKRVAKAVCDEDITYSECFKEYKKQFESNNMFYLMQYLKNKNSDLYLLMLDVLRVYGTGEPYTLKQFVKIAKMI